jgi:prepilin-type N-terminal cleavage/methylation domain-containing protein/prepilin-type processing-associated H-X9-DG protein
MRRGFTLMEVLVVVVILGTLAAILFPVFAQSRGAAERASCLANQRELALASVMYQRDHDDTLYPYGYWSDRAYVTWWGDLQTGDPTQGLLYPYTKSGRIRGCPGAYDLPNLPPHTFTMGYGVNFRLFFEYPPEGGPQIGFRTVSGSEVERPAETLLSADAANWDGDRRFAVGMPWLLGDAWSSHLQARHAGGRANVTWLDGHATTERLYFHVARLGVGTASVSPEELRAYHLGDLLKYPREDPYAPINGVLDQYYFLLQKPAGT